MEKKERLFSLDLLRGLDMFFLCCVAVFLRALQSATGWFSTGFMTQLRHEYTGFRLYDIIMPLFIFMCGSAVPFAMGRRIVGGKPTAEFWKHLFWRFFVLWALGIAVQGNLFSLDPAKLMYFSNTLQTIAIGYVAASLALLAKGKWVRLLLPVACFVTYGALMHFVGGRDYSQLGNLAMRCDKFLFAYIVVDTNPMMQANQYAWVLPSFMYVAMTVMGMNSTMLLMDSSMSQWKRAGILGGAAVATLAAGAVTSIWVPVIKPVFTISFTLYACGWSMLALAVLYVIADIWKFRRGTWILILYGQCALAAYILSHVFNVALKSASEKFSGGAERFMSHEWRMVVACLINCALLTFAIYIWREYRKRGK